MSLDFRYLVCYVLIKLINLKFKSTNSKKATDDYEEEAKDQKQEAEKRHSRVKSLCLESLI